MAEGSQTPPSDAAAKKSARKDETHRHKTRPATHRRHHRPPPSARAPAPQPDHRDEEAGPRSIIPMPLGTETIDRLAHANMGRITANLSPASIGQAFADWAMHLASSPGKQVELGVKALRKATRLGMYTVEYAANPRTAPCIEPLPNDHRFDEACWCQWPFNLFYQGFLLNQQWWWNATTDVRGVSDAHEHRVQFATRQMLDTLAPANFPWTNPQVIETTLREGGNNFVRGWQHFLEDVERQTTGQPPVGAENFQPGRDVAVTKGKVVYRNKLVELIQYEPTTETVHPEPVLIIPAWIMKYYILDLSPENSLIRWLRDQGHTVFCVSWRNPGAEDRDLSMEDYRRNGIEYVRGVVQEIVPERNIHAVGYCIGGTLLAIEAARMARDEDDAFASLTFLATQVDFEEPGELQLFIDESEVTYLEDIMWSQGYLDTKQMAGAFQMLRSNDLIWSRVIGEYMLGERSKMFDLMAWNADATRMPYRMHSEYLRHLFLNNDLAHGRYEVQSRPVALTDIRVPIFSVGTEKDHIAPWRSVYKIHLLSDTDVTFALTSGGHNAGIVSEPGHPRRHYRVQTTRATDPYRDPDTWLAVASNHEGSWWPEWQRWLSKHSGRKVQPPGMGNAKAGYPPLADAPGAYIHQR
ncbi:PHA/PHB synthase family protein [Ferruginivarius sediminum]|uniref:Alpha/beta fold hydrolase n=1 Tax=Ferruginivarius sediminum TaxID=2661937 RepID=A0A369TBH3_9PROT|nr:alpha/beta fold hydrolase [Ferruginivarius sediminum]RDD61864.1 alpha/beta fold hydrolase [Ferruginivarius sediminum]